MEDKIDFDKLFREAEGNPVVINGKSLVRIIRFKMPCKKMLLRFCFIETNSEWRQGFILKTKGAFKSDKFEEIKNAIVFWEDTAPQKFELSVDSKDGMLLIYNVWDFGNGATQAWHNGAAMEVREDMENEQLYYCNDGHPDFNFNDLIFSMSWDSQISH